MKKRGLSPGPIVFNTDYKYETDDWGMNSHMITSFHGATVLTESSPNITKVNVTPESLLCNYEGVDEKQVEKRTEDLLNVMYKIRNGLSI